METKAFRLIHLVLIPQQHNTRHHITSLSNITSCDNKKYMQINSWNYNLQQHPVQNSNFCIFIVVVLICRFMQQLEDALNIGLCGHFLIVLATLCLAAFSIVAVQYNKFCKIIRFEHYNFTLHCTVIISTAVHVHQPAASTIRINHLSIIITVTAGQRPTLNGLLGLQAPHLEIRKRVILQTR